MTLGGGSGTAELKIEGETLELEEGGIDITPHGKLTIIDGAVGAGDDDDDKKKTAALGVVNDGLISLDGGEMALDLDHRGGLEFASAGNLISGELSTQAGCSINPVGAAKSRSAVERAIRPAAQSKAAAENELTVSGSFTSRCSIDLPAIGGRIHGHLYGVRGGRSVPMKKECVEIDRALVPTDKRLEDDSVYGAGRSD